MDVLETIPRPASGTTRIYDNKPEKKYCRPLWVGTQKEKYTLVKSFVMMIY